MILTSCCLTDNAGESLMPIGMQAFLNYNPIRATVDPTEPLAFYRTVRWVWALRGWKRGETIHAPSPVSSVGRG